MNLAELETSQLLHSLEAGKVKSKDINVLNAILCLWNLFLKQLQQVAFLECFAENRSSFYF